VDPTSLTGIEACKYGFNVEVCVLELAVIIVKLLALRLSSVFYIYTRNDKSSRERSSVSGSKMAFPRNIKKGQNIKTYSTLIKLWID
jgi:hypothetical protein